jgi:hypothetical protein
MQQTDGKISLRSLWTLWLKDKKTLNIGKSISPIFLEFLGRSDKWISQSNINFFSRKSLYPIGFTVYTTVSHDNSFRVIMWNSKYLKDLSLSPPCARISSEVYYGSGSELNPRGSETLHFIRPFVLTTRYVLHGCINSSKCDRHSSGHHKSNPTGFRTRHFTPHRRYNLPDWY